MKKYFVLALALAIFAVAPVMADITLTGVFRMGAIWDVQEDQYAARLDRTRLYFDSKIDDNNSFSMEFRGDRAKTKGILENSDGTSGMNDTAAIRPYIHRAEVITDWAKYFGFADTVGIKSAVGYNGWTTFDKLGYTIYDIGGQEYKLYRDYGAKVNFDIAGIVKPYVAADFYAWDGTGTSYMAGVGVDFKPIWVEVFFMQNGSSEAKNTDIYDVNGKRIADDGRKFGAEAEFAMEVAEGMNLKIGGVLDMYNPKVDANKDAEWTYTYKVLAGFNAYGADIGLAFMAGEGDKKSYFPMGQVAVSAKYDIVKFLSVQAGTKFAFSDYSDKAKNASANDESWLGAEFGISVKPGKVKYDLGYLILNEDAKGAYFTGTTGIGDMAGDLGNNASGSVTNGGLYFSVNTKF